MADAEDRVDRMTKQGTLHPMFQGKRQRSPEMQRDLAELAREEDYHDRQMEARYDAQHHEDDDYERDED